MDKFTIKRKHYLFGEKERLAIELKKLNKYPEIGNSEDDTEEEVDQLSNYVATEDELLKEYRQVKLALKKIDDGSYLVCSNCRGEISHDRLKAYPAATTCIKCTKNA